MTREMSHPNEQPRELSDDLELGVEDAAKAVGGDMKPTASGKPVENLVFTVSNCMITAAPPP